MPKITQASLPLPRLSQSLREGENDREEHSHHSADRLRGGAAARGYDAHWRGKGAEGVSVPASAVRRAA